MAIPIVFVLTSLFGFLHCASSNVARRSLNGTTASDLGVTYRLYNRNHPNGIPISPNDTEKDLRSVYIKGIGVKFITHGWTENENRDSVVTIRKAYETTSDYNVVTVDWSPISKLPYANAILKVPEVGKDIGNMVIRLIVLKLTTLDLVHLIAHSLGAHIAGTAGHFIAESGYGKVGRISVLDPAGPFYENAMRPRDQRLDKGDAKFVDVIHTSIGVFGYSQPLGDADFYPNGGLNNQPGCSLKDNFCGHHRSYQYFAKSIYNEDTFPAVKCDSYANFQENKCKNRPVVYMGNPTPSSAKGKYYLKTNINGI